MLGYATNHKGYRLWLSKLRRIIVNRNVVFYEKIFPSKPQRNLVYLPQPQDIQSTPKSDNMTDQRSAQERQPEAVIDEENDTLPVHNAEDEAMELDQDTEQQESKSKERPHPCTPNNIPARPARQPKKA